MAAFVVFGMGSCNSIQRLAASMTLRLRDRTPSTRQQSQDVHAIRLIFIAHRWAVVVSPNDRPLAGAVPSSKETVDGASTIPQSFGPVENPGKSLSSPCCPASETTSFPRSVGFVPTIETRPFKRPSPRRSSFLCG